MLTLQVAPGTAVDTLGKAFALLPPDNGAPVTIHLAPGVYREKLTLRRSHTIIEGDDAKQTKVVFGDGAYEMLPEGIKRGTFRTATLMIDADHVTLRRLTVSNDAAPRETVGQAVALYVDGDAFTAEDCALLGYQDTLFTAPLPPKEIEKNGFIGPKQFAPRRPQRHVYRRCLITGDVDFIFGGAAAWFEHCEIRCVDGRMDRSAPYAAFTTAASTPQGQKMGYVFHCCRFTANADIPAHSVYLGRPWREYAKTVLLSCELGEHIHPAGFHDWNKPQAHETVFYAEHGSYGPGAAGTRAGYVHSLTDSEAAAYTLDAFLAHALEQA